MTPQTPSLADVVVHYVQAAMPIASANLQQGELIGLPTGRWSAQGQGQFQREDATQVSWVVAIDHRKDRLHALPEYEDAVALIQRNEEWARQFDHLVGTRYMRAHLDLAQFLDGCLGEALAASLEGRDPLAAAAARASSTEEFLNSRDVTIETFAPLLGFHSHGLGPVELTADLRLGPIDEAELERLFTAGLLTPSFPRWPFFAPPSHTVRVRYRTPKGVGELDASPRLPPEDPAKAVGETLEELVACLRVFQPGLIAIGGKASTMPPPSGGYQVHERSAGHPLFVGHMGPFLPNTYVLGESEVPTLQTLWREMHSPGFRVSKQLALAVRRFAYKGERRRVDDQLVDLIVAAEALFLGDGDESRGELRFRLSSRAACYIRDPSRSRRSIYRLFMAAYVLRSRLVHGSEAKPINVAGEEMSPAQVVEVIEDLLRVALNQAISEAASDSTTWAVDWEALLFPEPNASATSSSP